MLHALLRISSPLSPSSGEEVVSRVRQALSRLMTSAARQSALVAAANPNLATRAQASLSRTFPTSGLATVHKTIGGRLSDGPDKWPSYASSAGELCIEWSFSELSKTLASAALSAVSTCSSTASGGLEPASGMAW